MPQTPEGRVKAAVKKYLDVKGAYWCMPMGNGFGRSGVPDFLVCYRGLFLAIETKAPGKRGNTTTMQDKEIAGIHKAGGRAVVVDDVSALDVVFAVLDAEVHHD